MQGQKRALGLVLRAFNQEALGLEGSAKANDLLQKATEKFLLIARQATISALEALPEVLCTNAELNALKNRQKVGGKLG